MTTQEKAIENLKSCNVQTFLSKDKEKVNVVVHGVPMGLEISQVEMEYRAYLYDRNNTKN